MKPWANRCLQLLFPPKCGGCGVLLPFARGEDALCAACRGKWEAAKLRECPVCHEAKMDCLCSTEILRQAGVGQLIKLVAYRSDVRRDDEQFAVQNRLIYRIKDRHVRIFEYFLAKQLVLRLRPILQRENWTAENSLLTYCPRGRQKRLETGTDQSERIGRIVARELEIPFVPLIRRIGGQEQKMLGGTARAVNARGGFAAVRGADAAGKQVLLLDDIVTTGASMAACANVVWDLGAVRILAVSLAQTEA